MPNPVATVYTVALVAGALGWKMLVIGDLMANREVKLMVLGGPAKVVAFALKMHLPQIGTQQQTMFSWMVFALSVITVVVVQPLVDVLNFAFSRGYTVKVRYRTHGSGVQDDELTFSLVP